MIWQFNVKIVRYTRIKSSNSLFTEIFACVGFCCEQFFISFHFCACLMIIVMMKTFSYRPTVKKRRYLKALWIICVFSYSLSSSFFSFLLFVACASPLMIMLLAVVGELSITMVILPLPSFSSLSSPCRRALIVLMMLIQFVIASKLSFFFLSLSRTSLTPSLSQFIQT